MDIALAVIVVAFVSMGATGEMIPSLTCSDSSLEHTKDISAIFNLTCSFEQFNEFVVCAGTAEPSLVDQLTYTSLTFRIHEYVPGQPDTLCLGLLSYAVGTINLSGFPFFLYNMGFNSSLTIGKLICHKDSWNADSSADRQFVFTQLVPRLEKGHERYTLCVHERDFPLGSHIVDNIIATIQHSRKTIIVLSQHFISSKWCKWEMEMARHKMFNEDEQFLILILIEQVDRKCLPRHLKFMMDTRTYLEWPAVGDSLEEDACKRLKEALGPSIFQTTNERAPPLSDIMGTTEL